MNRTGPATLDAGVDRVLVVVPARDEELLLPGCLEALRRSAERCPVPVDVVVVADSCRDRTAAVGTAAGATVVPCTAGRVGAARALGVRVGLALGTAPARTWIANTDADSRVRDCWLEHQLDHALAGADLVLGVVELPAGGLGQAADPVAANETWAARYARGIEGSTHRHVHGANLGVRAGAYLAAGGFADLSAHEDVRLVEAVTALPASAIVRTVACPVRTSDRHDGRAPAGVSRDLRSAC